jgi:hypothetical protein
MELVSRAAWGAVPAESVTPWNPADLLGVTVHHFASPRAASTHAGCDDLMRGVQRGHMAGEFNDIAYNHCFCPHGVVFEARGFGAQTGANGTTAANRGYAAICFMGHTGLDGFPEVAQKAGAWLLSQWFKRGTNQVVVPHRKWTGSECPGEPGHTWVVSGAWKNDLPDPAPTRMRWEAWDEGERIAESVTEPIGDVAVENARLKTFVSSNLGLLGRAARNEGGVGDVKIVRRVLT